MRLRGESRVPGLQVGGHSRWPNAEGHPHKSRPQTTDIQRYVLYIHRYKYWDIESTESIPAESQLQFR